MEYLYVGLILDNDIDNRWNMEWTYLEEMETSICVFLTVCTMHILRIEEENTLNSS